MNTKATTTRKDCVFAICEFAKIYRADKNATPRDMFKRTGYRRHYASITQEQVIDLLRTHPILVDEWRMFSQDKRWTPAWFLKKRSENIWRVGYVDRGGNTIQEILFSDSASACALMIRMEMEDLRQRERNGTRY